MKANRTFLPLYVTNFFGTLNDNFLKTLACLTIIGWISDERAPPRDDACRGHDGARQGMVEAHAA